VGILERLDPRHWGGRRVLRVLTGLALVALTFVAQLGAPSAVTASVRPAAIAADATVAATAAAGASAGADSRPAPPGAEQAAVEQAGAGQAGAGQADPQRVAGAVLAAPAGSTPGSHGSRAPPIV
jgi:hypothetical protein